VHPLPAPPNGDDAVTYPKEKVKPVLERTPGCAISRTSDALAIVRPRLFAGEADRLRGDGGLREGRLGARPSPVDSMAC